MGSTLDYLAEKFQLDLNAKSPIEILKINGLAFGKGVTERIKFANGKATPGYENTGEREAPAVASLLKNGFPSR